MTIKTFRFTLPVSVLFPISLYPIVSCPRRLRVFSRSPSHWDTPDSTWSNPMFLSRSYRRRLRRVTAAPHKVSKMLRNVCKHVLQKDQQNIVFQGSAPRTKTQTRSRSRSRHPHRSTHAPLPVFCCSDRITCQARSSEPGKAWYGRQAYTNKYGELCTVSTNQ